MLEWKKESVSIDSLGRPDDTQANLDSVRVVNRNSVTSDKGEAQWAASSDPGQLSVLSSFLTCNQGWL